jgi:tetratricopeptide (TPR) repeat protein
VARALLGRSRRDPIAVAFHARLGGEIDVAVRALHEASMLAFDRHDADQADQLLSDALSLADSADLRLARARVRMARSLHDEAAVDAAAAIAFAPTAEAFELAGWIAYYRRDYPLAARLADDAVRHATDRALETSALALAGRVRHSHGELNEAEQLLQRASRDAPQPVQRLADVWLGALRVHQGRAHDALQAVDRGLVAGLDLGHPFAPIHALFAQTYAHAMLGSVDRAHQSLETMREANRRAGEVGHRFSAVVANLESWLLRSTGRYDVAEEASRRALELTIGTFGEPVSHAHLDLAELALRRGDVDDARAHVELTDQRVADHHTMSWHQRQRVWLMRSRCALAAGDLDTAVAYADHVVADAEQRGARRYLVLAQLQQATLTAALRRPLDSDAVAATVRDLGTVAGVDAWMLIADLAVASGDERWWRAAEAAAETFAAAAARDPRTDVTALREFITREFTRRRGATPARPRRRR